MISVGLNAGPAQAQPLAAAAAASGAPRDASTTPPVMGWASWNSFGGTITASVITSQIDAFVAAGLPKAGYKYIDIDEGWWPGTRDAAGNITVDTAKWPGGMAAIAAYIHSKGLKAGIYTDIGKNGCGTYFPTPDTVPAAPNAGSEGHYLQDMTQFENWGFDLVKVDNCGGINEGLDPQAAYTDLSHAVAQATAATGHPLALSLCEWGIADPSSWAPGLARMWRTSGDIYYYGEKATLASVLNNFDAGLHPLGQHTGYVNDPDMLTVGLPGLSPSQERTHLNLWAISGAPLLTGNNLATMKQSTLKLLTNREVIAVDQDVLGLQGLKVSESKPGLQVYSKVLAGSGRRAVVLLNRTATAAPITAKWADLGLADAPATVRDVWAAKTRGRFGAGYTATVPANGSVMVTVTGTDPSATTYRPASTGTFTGVTAATGGYQLAKIYYRNSSRKTVTSTLAVTGSKSTVVAFPPTGADRALRAVSVIITLPAGSAGTVGLSGASAAALKFDSLHVTALPTVTNATPPTAAQAAD